MSGARHIATAFALAGSLHGANAAWADTAGFAESVDDGEFAFCKPHRKRQRGAERFVPHPWRGALQL